MKIQLCKNVKYRGEHFKIGDVIKIKKEELEELEKAEIFDGIIEDEEDTNELEKMKVDKLKKLAKEKEIEGYASMKKDELIAALEEVE